jgi:hypothetical protein
MNESTITKDDPERSRFFTQTVRHACVSGLSFVVVSFVLVRLVCFACTTNLTCSDDIG